VPALVLLQVLRIYNYRAHLQLYAQRLRSAKVLHAASVTRKGSEVDLETETSSKELVKRLNATKGTRLVQIGLPVLLLLAVATVAMNLAVTPCSNTALGPAGLAIVLSPSIAIVICASVLCFALHMSGDADGFGIKTELFALSGVCMAGAAAQLVAVLAVPSAHKTAALVGTYRLGVAAIALALLVVQLACAAVRLGAEGDPVAQRSFDSLFDATNAQLKARFKSFLDTELSGHLMMFWDDVAEYSLAFSAPEPDVPLLQAESFAAPDEPAASLRRETVRKAKMGMAARSIFSRYIQPGAPLAVSVDKLMRTELTNRIRCNDVRPPARPPAPGNSSRNSSGTLVRVCERARTHTHARAGNTNHVQLGPVIRPREDAQPLPALLSRHQVDLGLQLALALNTGFVEGPSLRT
jgi:hypothetical protein